MVLGRITSWLTSRLEPREDPFFRLRFDALTLLKKATLDILQFLREQEDTEGGDQTKDKDARLKKPLTQDDSHVSEFCAALEACFKLGLKSQPGQMSTWWSVLYATTLVVDEPTMIQSIQTAALLAPDDDGKARCWLKIVLNNRTLESSLMILLSSYCEQVIWSSYEDWALLRCAEGTNLLTQMVTDLRDANFCIQVNGDPFRFTELVEDEEEQQAMGRLQQAEAAAQARAVSPSKQQALHDNVLVIEDENLLFNNSIFAHRTKLGVKPWQHVLGVSLAYLAKNPYHSRYAMVDPVLAVPNIVNDCVEVIMTQLDTPRLFRATVLSVTIAQMREYVELHGSVPADYDAHGAGAVLLDFLRNLPDPLLTSEKYDAFVASSRIREEEPCVRNLTCLVQDLPTHTKFTLERIITLLYNLQLAPHAEKNGLDCAMLSTIFAPVIISKKEITTAKTHAQYQDVRYAAVGAQVIEKLITHQSAIFESIRKEAANAWEKLERKKRHFSGFSHRFKAKPDLADASTREKIEQVTGIFESSVQQRSKCRLVLDPKSSTRESVSSTTTSTSEKISIVLPSTEPSKEPFDKLESTIQVWQSHGFNRRPSILCNFEHGGVLLLESLVYQLQTQDERILDRFFMRALPETTNYDAGLVSSAICSSLLNLLKLLPPGNADAINIIALSVEPFWELLDEEGFFVKLFVIFFDMFEYLWSHSPPEATSFTRVFTETEQRMDELLKHAPTSVMDVHDEWVEWIETVEALDTVSSPVSESDVVLHVEQPTGGSASPLRPAKKLSFTFRPEEYSKKLIGSSKILTTEQVAYIDHALPITCQLCRWCLLYSTDLHGSSLHSLITLCKNQVPTLIVVKDGNNDVFGGFASDEWRKTSHYYGNGECFLFTFADKKSKFIKYPWSRRNNYFMLCSDDSLVMGGGGSFGLYLDNDLSGGSTGICETFASKALSSTQEFVALSVEVWCFTITDKPMNQSEKKKRSILS